MRQFKALAVLLTLAGASGCAQLVTGDAESVVVETQPRSGAQCMLENDKGDWATLTTPATVTLLRSTAPLSIHCQTGDQWVGSAAIASDYSPAAVLDSVWPSGTPAGYPQKVTVTLAPGPNADTRPMFGIGGGNGIAPPLAAAADQARYADDQIATRFQTLRVLLDQGLITREEYNIRRGANLGALLRYSLVPPAEGLARPAPKPETLVARLRYLASAYAEHSISAAEQAAERAVILDGLLPARVTRRADPPPPIHDDLQVAAEIGRIERMQEANVITASEAAREKAKVHELLDASVAAADAAARAAAGRAATPTALTPSGSGIGVALTTYFSQARARRAWAALQKAHPQELGGLGLSLKLIPRPHRPSHYRIVAGPVADHDAAFRLCRALRHHAIPCEIADFPK